MGRMSTGREIVLWLMVFANVVLFGLLFAKQLIVIPPSDSPAFTENVNNVSTPSYEYTLESVSHSDGWHIEHFRQYEVTVDKEGDVLSRKPTGQTQHIRYWTGR